MAGASAQEVNEEEIMNTVSGYLTTEDVKNLITVAWWMLKTKQYGVSTSFVSLSDDLTNHGWMEPGKYGALIRLASVCQLEGLCLELQKFTMRGQSLDRYPTKKLREVESSFLLSQQYHVSLMVALSIDVPKGPDFEALKGSLGRQDLPRKYVSDTSYDSMFTIWKAMADCPAEIIPTHFEVDGYSKLRAALLRAGLRVAARTVDNHIERYKKDSNYQEGVEQDTPAGQIMSSEAGLSSEDLPVLLRPYTKLLEDRFEPLCLNDKASKGYIVPQYMGEVVWGQMIRSPKRGDRVSFFFKTIFENEDQRIVAQKSFLDALNASPQQKFLCSVFEGDKASQGLQVTQIEAYRKVLETQQPFLKQNMTQVQSYVEKLSVKGVITNQEKESLSKLPPKRSVHELLETLKTRGPTGIDTFRLAAYDLGDHQIATRLVC